MNPNPTKITSLNKRRVSQLPLSLIKGKIEVSVLISEGSAIAKTINAPISTCPSSAETDLAQSYILIIKLSIKFSKVELADVRV